MASVTTDHSDDRPPTTWLEAIDRWLHNTEIRRTILVIFLATLTTLIVVVTLSGSLLITCALTLTTTATGTAYIRAHRTPSK